MFTPDIDTLPANTLAPVNGIINPTNVKVDSNLTNPTIGDRYLILEDIGQNGSSSIIWNTLVAHANDIIEWNGSAWEVALDSATHNTLEYITNLNTNVQYKLVSKSWTKSVEGVYREGAWSIVL